VIKRVTRTITIEGDEEWVDKVLALCWLHPMERKVLARGWIEEGERKVELEKD
jgi:hypothetical protein